MANQVVYAGSRLTAALINSIAPLGAIKPTDQQVTSSTAMVNDNALSAPVAAGAVYLFQSYIDYTGGTRGSSDIQWQWSVPVGATLRYQADYENLSGNFTGGLTLLGSTVGQAATTGGGGLLGIKMMGSLVVSSTAGTIQFQWSQNTSNGTPTVVKAQSYLSLWSMP